MLVNNVSRDRSSIPFHILSKAIGSNCNLACRYCYYPQESHPGGRMDINLLEKFIREYIEKHPIYSKSINFVWQGGEPLLAGISFYKRVIAFQEKYRPKGVLITNTVQTNGTLITDEWSIFFKEYQFIVGISLDGDAILNDKHRIDKQGGGSHSKIVQGLKNLLIHQVEFNLLVVVHDEMVEFAKEVYQHFVKLGARYIQFQPLTSGGRANNRYQLSEDLWGKFLIDIYTEWRVSKHLGKVFITNIENSYVQYFTKFSPTCVHSKACGNQLALEVNGDIYACDHLINEGHYLGNLLETDSLVDMLNLSVTMPFGINKSKRRECQTCRVKLLCEGGCPTHIDSHGHNSLCRGYFQFFSVILNEVGEYPRNQEGLLAWQRNLNKMKYSTLV